MDLSIKKRLVCLNLTVRNSNISGEAFLRQLKSENKNKRKKTNFSDVFAPIFSLNLRKKLNGKLP